MKNKLFTRKALAETRMPRGYGVSITYGEYAGLVRKQQHRCAICRAVFTKPVVDHNHITGKIRGVLCYSCNIRLSGLEDTPWRRRAEKYLDKAR